MENPAALEQVTPKQNSEVRVVDVVIRDLDRIFGPDSHSSGLLVADLRDRATVGHAKYGTYLQPHNGRDATMDAYQELVDGSKYMRQIMLEGKYSDDKTLSEDYHYLLMIMMRMRLRMAQRDGK